MINNNFLRSGIRLFHSFLIFLIVTPSCLQDNRLPPVNTADPPSDTPYLIVLGTSQDGGYPQAGCNKECCQAAWKDPDARRLVSCLALVDPLDGKQWLIDATPDFREQLHRLSEITGMHGGKSITGIILTHAHIGHYTGLIHLGREVMGTKDLPVYTMPRMKRFLQENGPWDQLIKLRNIKINGLKEDSTLHLNERISVTPLLVPHRDEYTETIGLIVETIQKKVLYIPDIDKWSDWEEDICKLIEEADIVFLDGTFFMNGEIPGRDMKDIPHPFIEESMKHFEKLPAQHRSKIHFIHFNHTNPVVIRGSKAQQDIRDSGYRIAEERQIIKL